MKIRYKITAFTLLASMMLSCASCSLLDSKKNDKDEDEDDEEISQVIDAAEKFSQALIKGKTDTIIDLCSEEFSGEEDRLLDFYDFEDRYDEDKLEVLEFIQGEIDYKVDDDSAKIKKKSASVDVEFEVYDYTKVEIDGFWDSSDSCISALKDAGKTKVTVTIEFEIDDDDFLVSNPYDVMDDVFKFLNMDLMFNSVSLSSAIQGYYMQTDEEDVYEIYMYFFLDDAAVSMIADTSVYYEVTSAGQLVFRSEMCDITDDFTFGKNQNAQTTSDGYLVPGIYTITVYDAEGNELKSETCNVTVSTKTVEGGTTLPAGSTYVAGIDYTDTFMKSLGETFNPVGSLTINMYLILGDEATLMIHPDDFKTGLITFMANNLDPIIATNFGMSASEFAELSGMTVDELKSYFTDAMLSQIDSSSNFNSALATGSYTINGSTITINFPDGTLTGTISGNTITFNVSNGTQLAQYTKSSSLTFVLQ